MNAQYYTFIDRPYCNRILNGINKDVSFSAMTTISSLFSLFLGNLAQKLCRNDRWLPDCF